MDHLENILDTGGRYLSPADRQFVNTLLAELEQFQYQAPKDRALMFHPLGGFQRYLIHKVTQVFPKLTSFSIGDEKNRRTVVCFKAKRKDQQLEMQGFPPPSKSSPRNEYVNLPKRGREEEASRRSTPATRSRDSSRSRKKQDPEPARNRAGSSSHVPRPLRAKKTATKRDQMKRSRSLQSSPVRDLSDEDRGRRRSQQEKRAPRSSSLKPPSRRRRERTESPIVSEDDVRRGGIRPNVSDASLHKRGQGLRMEGRVMNGDIEDPYSCGDSESDAARVDADAIWREKERHRRTTPSHEQRHPPPRSRSYDSSNRSMSEDSDRAPERKPHRQEREESDSDEVAVESSHHEEDNEEYSEEEDYDSPVVEERPPSYSSIKRSASLKKAERNLERIKRADSHHSRASTERDSSSSGSTKHPPKRSSSSKKPSKEVAHPKRSSTLPKSMKEPAKKMTTSKRSQTLKTTGSDVSPRVRTQATQSNHVEAAKASPKRSSMSSLKSRSKTRSSHPKLPVDATEVDGPQGRSASKDSMDAMVNGSNTELYIPLPEKPGKSKREEKRSKPKQPAKAPHATKSAPSSPAKSKPAPPARCDGAAQTDVTGTLSRKKKPAEPEPTTQPTTEPPPTVELITAMMQSLAAQQQPNSAPYNPSTTPYNPNNMNAFHQFMQNAPQHPQASFPPLPPHLMHQLYMSWLGAYYAGATGTWPPPVPPSFLMQPPSNASSGSQMPSFELPPFLNPANAPQHPREQERHLPPERKGEPDPHYDSYYPPASKPEEFAPRYDHREYPPFDHVTGDLPSSNYENPGFRGSYRHDPAAHRPQDARHENGVGSSSAPTDTDTSSVTSKKSEVAVSSNPRGGVMIYVRSQTSASSTGGMYDSRDSLSTSDAAHSIASTPHDRGSLPSLSIEESRKKSPKTSSNKRKPTSTKAKNGESSRKAPPRGEKLSNGSVSNRPKHSSNDAALREDPAFLELNPPLLSLAKQAAGAGSSNSVNTSTTSRDGIPNVSQEEIILSLRRAPLATIEDDADELLSESQASSMLSLSRDDERSSKPSVDPSFPSDVHDDPVSVRPPSHKRDSLENLPSPIVPPYETPRSSQELPPQGLPSREDPQNVEPVQDHEADSHPPTAEASTSSHSDDESPIVRSRVSPELSSDQTKSSHVQPLDESRDEHEQDLYGMEENSSSTSSASSIILEMHAITSSESAESEGEDEEDEELPPPPEYSVAVETQPPLHPEMVEEHLHPPPEAAGPLNTIPGSFSPPHSEIPLIDNSESDHSEASSSEHEAEQSSDIAENGVATSKDSSENGVATSKDSSGDSDDGNTENDSSDVASKDESSQSERLRHSLVNEVDGDVVVQAPQFDYYNSLPPSDVWKDEKFKKCVEIYDLPAELSDLQVAQHLSKYRGLRLSRVDATRALCILPTPEDAMELLGEESFRTRPLHEASQAAKNKAKAKLENDEFEAVRATRPKTDPAVAKRMIAASLGNNRRQVPPSGKRPNGATPSDKK